MKGKMTISVCGDGGYQPFEKSGIHRGRLNLPDGVSCNGDLIAIGEDETHLHCVISGTGELYQVFKSHNSNHIYQHLLSANAHAQVRSRSVA